MHTLLSLLELVIRGAIYVIIAGVILSMIRQATYARSLYNPVVDLLIGVSDTLCRPFRRMLDRSRVRTGPFDFSPMLAIVSLEILLRILASILV